jgi:hypothetical protein
MNPLLGGLKLLNGDRIDGVGRLQGDSFRRVRPTAEGTADEKQWQQQSHGEGG